MIYTDGKPSDAIVRRLSVRKDNQIMALESIAIALGLSTFEDELKGCKVVVSIQTTRARKQPRVEGQPGHGTIVK